MPMDEYRDRLEAKMTPVEKDRAQHAFDKMKGMQPEIQNQYLTNGKAEPFYLDKYSASVLPHNEVLIQPNTDDVMGVYLNSTNATIAVELQSQFKQATGIDLPYMRYDEATGRAQEVPADQAPQSSDKPPLA
jgi:hypothetical protein